MLTGKRRPTTSEKIEPTADRLRRRREVVAEERAARRKFKEEQNKAERKHITRDFSKLKLGKYLNEGEMNASSKDVKEYVPELEEFIALMKQQEKEDVRHKTRLKIRVLQLKKKFSKVDPVNERFSDSVGGITDSQPCRLHCYDKIDIGFHFMSYTSKRNFLVKKLFDSGGNVIISSQKLSSKPKRVLKPRRLQTPLIYITTVTGLTYLHPVSKEMAEVKRQECEKAKSTKQHSPQRKPLLVRNLSRAHKAHPKVASSTADKQRGDQKVAHPAHSSCIESSDSFTDSESDSLEDSPFNTKKLNIRYSLERIRMTKATRDHVKKTMETDVVNVLKTFYRVQSVLWAFSKGKRGIRPPMEGLTHRTLRKSVAEMVEEPGQSPAIGKMKWFPFLETRARPGSSESADEPVTEAYPLQLFREHLERALDEFVVRKELVVSDHRAKASVSITFTRKTVFRQHKTCKQTCA